MFKFHCNDGCTVPDSWVNLLAFVVIHIEDCWQTSRARKITVAVSVVIMSLSCAVSGLLPLVYRYKSGHSIECVTHAGHSIAFCIFNLVTLTFDLVT